MVAGVILVLPVVMAVVWLIPMPRPAHLAISAVLVLTGAVVGSRSERRPHR